MNNRLAEIREEMIELFEEAKDIIGRSDKLTKFDHARAKAYWMGYLENFLVEEKDYMNSCTMFETIEAMGAGDEGEDSDGNDKDGGCPECHGSTFGMIGVCKTCNPTEEAWNRFSR